MTNTIHEDAKAAGSRGGKAEGLVGQAGRTASSALEQTKDAMGRAGEALRDKTESARTHTVDAAEDVYASGRRAAQSVGRQVERQPLSALLLAMTAGYFIGYLVHGRR